MIRSLLIAAALLFSAAGWSDELPTMLIAAVVLLVAVLPAEYGIDPSGLGKRLGLTQLHQADSKTAPLSTENNIDSAAINLTLLPKQGMEVKAHMQQGETQFSGTFTAPFTGLHGWYWENETDKPVTVTLATEGYYLEQVMH